MIDTTIDSRRGAVSLGLAVLIFIIVAVVVLIILSSAVRTYIIGGFSYLGSLFNQANNSGAGGGTTKTTFIAYYCQSAGGSCAQFTPDYLQVWFVDYNGMNLSSQNLSTPIVFTTVAGNFSFTAYDINASGNTVFCNNLTLHSGYLPAGDVKLVYYSLC